MLCGGVWLERKNVEEIAGALGLKVAPVIDIGPLRRMVGIVANGGNKSAFGDFVAEGIVARPRVELMTRRGDRVITKLKVRDFKS